MISKLQDLALDSCEKDSDETDIFCENPGKKSSNCVIKFVNNHIHSDSKKRRSFLALLFTAGDAKR